MNVGLLAPAASELDEPVAWYAAQAPGLERRFIDEMKTARKRIAERPHAWHPLGNGVRRFRLGRFPYGLIYVRRSGRNHRPRRRSPASQTELLAIACVHAKPLNAGAAISRDQGNAGQFRDEDQVSSPLQRLTRAQRPAAGRPPP
jgi:hypothetical protein